MSTTWAGMNPTAPPPPLSPHQTPHVRWSLFWNFGNLGADCKLGVTSARPSLHCLHSKDQLTSSGLGTSCQLVCHQAHSPIYPVPEDHLGAKRQTARAQCSRFGQTGAGGFNVESSQVGPPLSRVWCFKLNWSSIIPASDLNYVKYP